jgi:hypothetical protein
LLLLLLDHTDLVHRSPSDSSISDAMPQQPAAIPKISTTNSVVGPKRPTQSFSIAMGSVSGKAVLFYFCVPSNATPLDYDAEMNEIKKSVRDLISIAVDPSKDSWATLGSTVNVLKPKILWISCHGGYGYGDEKTLAHSSGETLAMLNTSTTADLLSAACNERLECVVLACCSGANLAKQLLQNSVCKNVIYFNSNMLDRIAPILAGNFFAAIADSKTYAQAFKAAKSAVSGVFDKIPSDIVLTYTNASNAKLQKYAFIDPNDRGNVVQEINVRCKNCEYRSGTCERRESPCLNRYLNRSWLYRVRQGIKPHEGQIAVGDIQFESAPE